MSVIKNIFGKGTIVRHEIQYMDWSKKRYDHYNADYEIEGKKVFVKRFEEPPAGLPLLSFFSGQSFPHLPDAYDIVIQTEDEEEYSYYIGERIEGKTLDEYIKEDPTFLAKLDVRVLAQQILLGLQTIHKYHFWFSDLNEQNIMYSEDKKCFYLIDLDSVWSAGIMPNLVNQEDDEGEIAATALDYIHPFTGLIQKISGKSDFTFDQLDGKTINYLQVLALAARFKNLKEQRSLDTGYSFSKTRSHIAPHIEGAIPAFGNVFDEKNLNGFYQKFDEWLDAVLNYTYKVPKMALTTFDVSPSEIERGNMIELTWATENAYKVFLTGGEFQNHSVAANGNQKVRLSEEQTIIYTLSVVSQDGNRLEQSRTVQVVKPQEPPQIITFKVHRTTVNLGESVHLVWKVFGADKVFVNYKLVDNQGHQILTPQKSATWTLLAQNDYIEKLPGDHIAKKPKEIKITVLQPIVPKSSIWVVIAVLLLSIAGWLGWNYYLDNLDAKTAANKGMEAYSAAKYATAIRYLQRSLDVRQQNGTKNPSPASGAITTKDIQNDASQATIHHTLAKCYLELKQQTTACEQLIQARRLDQQSLDIQRDCLEFRCQCQ
jgi:serine/threonine protein kinase